MNRQSVRFWGSLIPVLLLLYGCRATFRATPAPVAVGVHTGSKGKGVGVGIRVVPPGSAPPRAFVEVKPTAPGPRGKFFWVAGRWKWNGHKYVWVKGSWKARPKGHSRKLWVDGHWKKTRRGHVWVESRWR